jgi:hypothetical protein
MSRRSSRETSDRVDEEGGRSRRWDAALMALLALLMCADVEIDVANDVVVVVVVVGSCL